MRRTEEGAQTFYEDAHRLWWPSDFDSRAQVRDRVRRSVHIIKSTSPSVMAELGFEDPAQSAYIASLLPKTEYHLVDIDRERVQLAQNKGFSAEVCDLGTQRLSFKSDSLDLIYMAEVIEHIYNTDHALKEIFRVLKTGGHLILTTPNLSAWYNRVLLFVGIQPIGTEVSTEFIFGRKFRSLGQNNRPVGHIRVFTKWSLIDFLTYHGFKILSIEGYSDTRVPFDRIFARFPSIASGFVVHCIKPRK